MTMGRKAFLTSATLGLAGVVAGCSPTFGPGGAGVRTGSEDGPSDADAVLAEAQVADLPSEAAPEMTERAAPEGYDWAREVAFSAPTAEVDAWLEESFGSADVAPAVFTLNPAVAEAFEVEDVPETWRSMKTSVEGTRLELMLLIDDADPAAVRLHLRRRQD
ncbi:MAG: hypothetical protein GX960_10540 [Actinomycetales bacterium]|nr:hypothetical protein [Actinomycetales bacterium]